MDEDFTTGAGGGSVTGSAYGLGARGIDMIRPFTVSGGTRSYGEAQFPIYDGHGNVKCTLSRSGSSPYYSIANSRSYDVWGGVRDGSSTGDPNVRYCGNLGHKQDDESGLIYMRARYYEPGTGRFVSEDPARDGANWFSYCCQCPVSNVDANGLVTVTDQRSFDFWMGMGILAFGIAAMMLLSPIRVGFERSVALVLMPAAAAAFASAFGATSAKQSTIMGDTAKVNWCLTVLAGVYAAFEIVRFRGGIEKLAVFATSLEALILLGILVSMDYD